MAQYLNHKKIFCLTRRIFPTVKIFWWTPLFIKQWMDSVRFILKIVREREKLGPVSFWLRPLFASSVIFCESVIAGVLSIQTHPDLLLVSSDHVTGMLRSHWSVLPSCLTLTVSINWANSTQKYNSRRKLYDRTMIKDPLVNQDLSTTDTTQVRTACRNQYFY